MASQKRKRAAEDDQESSTSDVTIEALSDDDIDISSALVGNGQRKQEWHERSVFHEDGDGDSQSEQEDDGILDIIHDSTTRRNIKDGTQLIKKIKGRSKIAKGEVGGGSFQSMGEHLTNR